MATSSRDLDNARRALAGGDLERGERLLRRVLAAAPGNSVAHELMAYVFDSRGDPSRSLEHLRRATQSPQASAAAWYQLGVALRREGRSDEARLAFERSIARDARFLPAHHDLGVLLYEMDRAQESLAALDRAIAIEPSSFESHHNRGRTLHKLRRHEEALASYDRALALRADHPATYLNRGEVLSDLRRYPQALADYHKAVDLHPQYDDARWNESLTRLLLGDFEEGWKLYECRWSGATAWPRRHSGIRAWNGQEVRDKRVLVWWEQGFGDTLHFCRYVPLLLERGADVVFEVQAPLESLMSSLHPRVHVAASGEAMGPYDYQVPLLSLPLLFRTTLETIPAHVPYLRPREEKVRSWRERLQPMGGKNIAIAASGHSGQKDDKARSIPLACLAPLARIANLFVVQVDIRDEDRDFAMQPGSGMRLLDAQIHDFEDSAAILQNMDAVVSVDSALAHLAGALAKPTWIMLPWTPTWRWMVDRGDSPWYPTARLVRQQAPDQWDDVVARVCAALET